MEVRWTLVLLGVIIGAAVATGAYMLAGKIHIEGVFNPGHETAGTVWMEPPTIELDLGEVREAEGSRTWSNVAVLHVEANASVLFRLADLEHEGEGSVVMSGQIVLTDPETGRSYTVAMPCLVAAGPNATCYRVMALLPGYDVPMPIEPGDYNVTVTLHWRAQGESKVELTIAVEAYPGTETITSSTTRPTTTTQTSTTSATTTVISSTTIITITPPTSTETG